jgi:hypothetical protein
MPSDKRATLALAMVRRLHAATGGRLDWRSTHLVPQTAEQIDAISYAVAQGWLESRSLRSRIEDRFADNGGQQSLDD